MLSRSIKIITTYAFMLLLVTAAFGQQNQGQTQTKPDPQYVDFSGFKGKVFEVKHRAPSELRNILSTLGSGFKGATISSNDEFKILTVRDFPENIAAIEEALKRLDVPMPEKPPSPPRPRDPDVELRLHVLIASNVEGASNQYPDDLKEVVKQMQGTLNYKNYYHLTPIVQRFYAPSGSQGMGVATVGAPLFNNSIDAEYRYHIRQIIISSDAKDTMLLNGFEFSINGSSREFGTASINNKLTIRDGEKVVIGTASLRDKGLIIVLTAKIIK